MFLSSTHFLLFDYFRIPYRIDDGEEASTRDLGPLVGCGWIRPDDGDAHGRSLSYWRTEAANVVKLSGASFLDGSPLFCPIIGLDEARALLAATGERWFPAVEIVDDRGSIVSAVWRDERGRVFLPFDPAAAIRSYWSESYGDRSGRRPASPKRLAMRAYYLARPLLPRRVQIALRRGFSRIQARTRFPRWPVETALHDLYTYLLGLCADVAGEAIPLLAPWPEGKSWALCLTHDVETAAGYEQILLMRNLERSLGYRSSWNLVPKRYAVDDATVRALRDEGFEVGVHGLYHDGRDLESERTLRERLPAIREYAARWDAVGFRSPATHRDWELMPLLGFDYDSSSPDTDPFEPQSGGCCTWWPFFNGDLVELPVTLVQDHTLFVILRRADEQLWVDKTELLRERQGMALIITHPDYMLDEERLGSYRRFLVRYATEKDVWRALPREISSWWRRRSESTPVREGSGWRITGPAAADAAIVLHEPGERL